MAIVNEYKLSNSWNFYIHLHNVDDWSFSSYHKIQTLNSVEQAILLNEEINFELIKKNMIFVMKDNIKKMWVSYTSNLIRSYKRFNMMI